MGKPSLRGDERRVRLYVSFSTHPLIQCRPLKERRWRDYKAHEKVHLVVFRPVQREVDKLKNYGLAARRREFVGHGRS